MKLLEIIPGEETKPEVTAYMTRFCEQVLGKGVVICKDVPNFIGNRIGSFDISNAIRIMVEKNLRIDELDAIIGKALGQARFGDLRNAGSGRPRHRPSRLVEPVCSGAG